MTKDEAFARLQGLATVLRGLLGNLRANIFDPQTTSDLFVRFESIAASLRALDPGLFADLPQRASPEVKVTSDFSGRGYHWRAQLDALLRDVEYCITVLKTQNGVSVPSMKVTREGVFFAGQYYDAMKVVTDFVSEAKSEITLVDNYIGTTTLDLLSAKAPNVKARILTRDVAPAVRAAAEAFNKQYGGLEIRTTSSFHDRFLVVDQAAFYHFGASIKDLGHRGFMFSVLEEHEVLQALKTKLLKEWSTAQVVM